MVRERINQRPSGLAAMTAAGLVACLVGLGGCGEDREPLRQPPPPKRLEVASEEAAAQKGAEGTQGQTTKPTAKVTVAQARAAFGVLPQHAQPEGAKPSAALINLGRQLYYEKRLSKNHDISCNTCHVLTDYGIDSREGAGHTSQGHKGALGDRNSPTVYNAALHIAQFWDGRAKDVEEQVAGPLMNPVEMAMPDERRVLQVLRSIPGYRDMFSQAFPQDEKPIRFKNIATAIGAFERNLVTPAPFDAWLEGDGTALNSQQLRGLQVFMDSGCSACHSGPGFGGRMYQKLGLLKPYPTEDEGRAVITGNAGDKHFFKVPSLRNVAETAPYMHDGSISTLAEMVQIMAEYQTPKSKLSEQEIEDLLAFLKALTGRIPQDYISEPETLPSGPKTPAADPS